MGELVIFPYIKRVEAMEDEMPRKDRIYLRRLSEKFSFLRNDNNVTSIVDVREEQLMTTLGW